MLDTLYTTEKCCISSGLMNVSNFRKIYFDCIISIIQFNCFISDENYEYSKII